MSETNSAAPAPAAPKANLLGMKIGEQITIAKRIGKGRLGELFAGVHPVLARRFAIKVIRSVLTKDEGVQRRLRRMVREASTVEHANVISLVDIGQLDDGRFYLTMDFVRGTQLTRTLKQDGKLGVARAVPLLIQLADALEAAHKLRVIHGDVKPNNVLLLEEHAGGGGGERLRIHDFKLAQALSGDQTETDPLGHLRIYSTLDYLSPEQINNGRVDGRADIYAFGAVAYHMLTGEPPFVGNAEEVMQAHRARDPVPPSRRMGAHEVPVALDAIVLRCLEKNPADRYTAMGEVSRELQELLPEAEPYPFEEEETTGRWKLPPELQEIEEPLPESPARVRELFYDSIFELAEHIVTAGTPEEEMKQEIEAVRRIKDEMVAEAAKSAVTENRFEDIRRELRERESTLRYAIIDLNLGRADLKERSAPENEIHDVEFQISELEHNLTELEKQRSSRFATLNVELEKSRETLKLMEQQRAIHYRRLYAHIDEARPSIKTDVSAKLYRLIERCRGALSEATAKTDQ
jgi:hypothetical protein